MEMFEISFDWVEEHKPTVSFPGWILLQTNLLTMKDVGRAIGWNIASMAAILFRPSLSDLWKHSYLIGGHDN